MTDNTTPRPLKPGGLITATLDTTDTLPLTLHHRAGLTIALDPVEAIALLDVLRGREYALREAAGETVDAVAITVKSTLLSQQIPDEINGQLTPEQWEEVERRVLKARGLPSEKEQSE